MNQYGSIKANEKTIEQKILESLKKRPGNKITLASEIGSTPQRISEYLSKMKKRGKVERTVIYTIKEK